jgi:hypothetical protein
MKIPKREDVLAALAGYLFCQLQDHGIHLSLTLSNVYIYVLMSQFSSYAESAALT